MPIPEDTSLESINKESCISFFEKLFSVEELKEKIRLFSPENLVTTSKKRSQTNRKSFFEMLGILQIRDKTKLAKILYEMLGPHFLYEIHGVGPNNVHSQNLRYEIFNKAIELEWINLDTISKVVEKLPSRHGKGIKSLDEINSLRIPGPWRDEILNLIPSKFDLPSEVSEAPSSGESKGPNIEIITAIRELRPLHDYQIFAGKKIRDLLIKPKNIRKRLLISIPTGAGKTRLVAESLIDWINDDKPSSDLKTHNSKYMIWIAQSRELCEQAISQFKEIYSQKGKSALTIFRFFGNRPLTLDTILNPRVEHGLIVCTIDKIYNQIKDIENLSDFNQDFFQNALEYDDKVQKSKIPKKFYDDRTFGRLRKMTSCVVVDEAHKAIMPTYTCVLRGLGFNFSYKDEEKCNEAGITLIGLTATAFRGTGLERSREVTIGELVQDKVKLSFYENGIERYGEANFPLNCTECKKPLISGEKVLQSTSNRKLIWHNHEQKLSAETTRIYTRFSEPLIPKIHAFQENKKPKAIITCNEKCVANDPIRISGEKSYDLLGQIVDYSWKIERRSNLTEIFNIEQPEKTVLHQPKPLPVIVEEFNAPGNYKISLTVKNYDGLTNITTKIIEVIPSKQTETSDEMKDLIQNLIKREILCEVFHTYIKSGKIDIIRKKDKVIDFGGQIRTKAAENNARNEKLVNAVHYLLTVPEEKRKKILVFACDILHARFLTLWLKTKFDISVEYIDSSLHESRNISRIQKFREKSDEHGKVLINTNMLTTGFDVPDVDCVVMGRPVMSTVEYTQMIGRGMRGPRMGGTKEVWIVDFDDQVQLSEHMKNQAIPLGWKAMAFDDEDNLIWKSLSEKKDKDNNPLKIDVDISDNVTKTIHVDESWNDEKSFSVKCSSCEKLSEGVLEISNDYGLSDNEKNELTKFAESGITPQLSVLKNCSSCKKVNEIFPDFSDPWKKLIIKEKSNPVLLEFVNYIAENFSGTKMMNITKILNVEEISKKIIQKDPNASELEQLEKEIFTFSEHELIVIQNKIDQAKNTVYNYKLGEFTWKDHVILQKTPTSSQNLASLCRYLLSLNPLKNLVKQTTLVSSTNKTLDEQLKEKTENIIFNVLGFIPEEDKFQEIIGDELYAYMIKKYTTYHNFQQHIPIAKYILKLHKRSQCLDALVIYYQKYRKRPDAVTLETIITDFKNTVKENFDNSKPNFFKMMKQITDSINFARNMDFEEIKADYENVRALTPFSPSTEEILRHSKIGIGQYIRCAGTISNFQQIYELVDDSIRIQFEQIKHKFLEIKKSLGSIPTEDMMKRHTDYQQLLESGALFDSYEKFLEFLGESPEIIKQNFSKESKNEIISNAKSLIRRGGMQESFEKIAQEPELKYQIHFGSVEKFIELLFPDNKQVALMRWKDIKKKY